MHDLTFYGRFASTMFFPILLETSMLKYFKIKNFLYVLKLCYIYNVLGTDTYANTWTIWGDTNPILTYKNPYG